jgi:nucleotide-binding universal stress UspA family protein
VTLLVGLSPDARDDAGGAVGLAARLAVVWGEGVRVAVVVTPGARDTDGAAARAAVEGVLSGAGVPATWETVRGRSVAEALLEAAGAAATTAVVLGTDPDRSGRIAVRVARSSPVPVVLARGAGSMPGQPVERVTCAFDGTAASVGVLAAAAELADRSGATLRVVSFAVRRPGPPATDASMVAGWTEQIAAAQAEELAALGRDAETGVHAGATWDEAVHAAGWGPGDLLVVGGSPGAATRFFLGDRVGAILQAAPVPAVIVRSG